MVMQNLKTIDISSISLEYHKLAYDFIDFLKSKSTKSSVNKCNYDREKLLSTLKNSGKIDIFPNIEDSVTWQREIRDDR